MASIHKRTNKDGSKSWVVYYRDQNRKQSKRSFKLKKDAEAFRAKVATEVNEGTFRQIENKAFEEVADKWLELKRPSIRPKTYESYKAHVGRLNGVFGRKAICNISPLEVEEFIAELPTYPVTNNGNNDKRLSASSQRKTITYLNSIFEAAIRWGYASTNPVKGAKKPKIPKKEISFLTQPEIQALIIAAQEAHKCLLMVACYTGMRQGELIALKWEEIDFINNKINIRRTFQSGRFFEPKTQNSKRQIYVPQTLLRKLEIHRTEQAVNQNANPDNLVFPNREGKPLDPRNLVTRIFEPALRIAGLPRINFHALRHSYASMLIAQGVNIKVLQKQLGHSSAQLTWDCYSHLYPDAELVAIQKLEETIACNSERDNQVKSSVSW